MRLMWTDTAAQSAVVQWITVPPDKVKSDATVIKAGEKHLMICCSRVYIRWVSYYLIIC